MRTCFRVAAVVGAAALVLTVTGCEGDEGGKREDGGADRAEGRSRASLALLALRWRSARNGGASGGPEERGVWGSYFGKVAFRSGARAPLVPEHNFSKVGSPPPPTARDRDGHPGRSGRQTLDETGTDPRTGRAPLPPGCADTNQSAPGSEAG